MNLLVQVTLAHILENFENHAHHELQSGMVELVRAFDLLRTKKLLDTW